jgi:hypothetical protein
VTLLLTPDDWVAHVDPLVVANIVPLVPLAQQLVVFAHDTLNSRLPLPAFFWDQVDPPLLVPRMAPPQSTM